MAWESARRSPRGLPPAIAQVLDSSEAFRDASLLLGIPEHQVTLAGGGHSSQTDFWALLDAPSIGVSSMAIESKAGEPFDALVSEWLKDAKPTSGKPARLQQLCDILGMSEVDARTCRYQLLHRPVAAILEARRFRVSNALFLVHAFGDNSDSFAEFKHWARILGVDASDGVVVPAGERGGVTLWLGWCSAPVANDQEIRDAV